MDRTTAQWERVQPVLERALELPPEEVGAFLDGACAGDDALRADVESLIAADRSAPEFLDLPAVELAFRAPPPPASLEGTRLGAFRVLARIGRGGMSTVHLGERVDRQFEQRVAIKVLEQDAKAAGMAGRFRTERRILGSLDHRGIVRILDGGVTDDGRPYLVMEHIEGERIDAWCDARRLTVAERLRLFRKVLDAVAYAHRALVVHRDLKPDNILVTADGEVRLLDFGIAKILDAGEDADATPTRTGLRPMTPEYAAPEQVRGERITTACDIYALGVLLYELLAGQRPYTVDATSPYAFERAILESEPDRPSNAVLRTDRPAGAGRSRDVTAETIAAARRTEPVRLRSVLDGDLDAIVLKALRKEPEERYGSADAFGEDIDRYLGSLPVLARRGTRAYRVRKFVRRHRAGVAVGTAAALLILASSAAVAASRVGAERARERAEREARTAGEVTDFLVRVFAGSDPNQTLGDSVSARTLLERGRARIDVELLGEPLVRASLLTAIGEVYSGLGRFEAADTLLTQAAELRLQELGENDIAVVRSFHELGANRNAWRDYPAAIEHLERALRIHARLDPHADSADVRARILTSLGTSLRELGRPDSSRVVLDRALAIDRARGDSLSHNHLVRRIELGATLRALEDYAGATRVYDDVLPRLRRSVGDEHPLYSTVLNNAAFLRTRQGQWADAVPPYRESLEIARRVFGPDHPRVLTLQANLASALYESGAPEEALAALRDRLEATRRAFPGGHWRVGSAHEGVGKLLLRIGRHADAETEFRQALASYVATIGPDNTWTLVAETWVVLAMTMRGDPQGPALLDRAVRRLDGAPLDGDTSADLERIAAALDGLAMSELAGRFRALLAARPN